MTLEQAKQVYVAGLNGVPCDDYEPDEWEDIRKEMERIVAAPTERKAADVIRWWGCWDARYTATAFARRVRECAKKEGIV